MSFDSTSPHHITEGTISNPDPVPLQAPPAEPVRPVRNRLATRLLFLLLPALVGLGLYLAYPQQQTGKAQGPPPANPPANPPEPDLKRAIRAPNWTGPRLF